LGKPDLAVLAMNGFLIRFKRVVVAIR